MPLMKLATLPLIIGAVPPAYELRPVSEPLIPGVSGEMLLAAALAAPGAALAAWLVLTALRRDRARGGPGERLLARSLRLTRDQLRLLRRAARAADLPNAACLLISRGCFDFAVERYAARGGDSAALRGLRRKLYSSIVGEG